MKRKKDLCLFLDVQLAFAANYYQFAAKAAFACNKNVRDAKGASYLTKFWLNTTFAMIIISIIITRIIIAFDLVRF